MGLKYGMKFYVLAIVMVALVAHEGVCEQLDEQMTKLFFQPCNTDLLQSNPGDFLNDLKARFALGQRQCIVPQVRPFVLSELQIATLLKLSQSNEPCVAVATAISSYLAKDGSTVGVQALHVIEGSIKKVFPPRVHSVIGGVEPETRKELESIVRAHNTSRDADATK